MTPIQVKDELDLVVKNRLMDPIYLVGPSGIGKTDIVNQVGARYGLGVLDIRWGQLMPADARGVPFPDKESKSTEFFPPDFWPRSGRWIIFLDEFNQASPTMMGLAQQLLLSRRFGSYEIPGGPDDLVFVWAAGNRKVDRAAVNEVPGPVNNRLIHLDVEADTQSWEVWAHANGLSPQIIGFIKWRGELLHKFTPDSRAWPSPRSWTMADRRLKVGMSIGPAVGDDTESEFLAFLKMWEQLPNLVRVAEGDGRGIKFPYDEPSLKYATIAELTRISLAGTPRTSPWSCFANSASWAIRECSQEPDWVSCFVQDYCRILKNTDVNLYRKNLANLVKMPDLVRFVKDQAQVGGFI